MIPLHRISHRMMFKIFYYLPNSEKVSNLTWKTTKKHKCTLKFITKNLKLFQLEVLKITHRCWNFLKKGYLTIRLLFNSSSLSLNSSPAAFLQGIIRSHIGLPNLDKITGIKKDRQKVVLLCVCWGDQEEVKKAMYP